MSWADEFGYNNSCVVASVIGSLLLRIDCRSNKCQGFPGEGDVMGEYKDSEGKIRTGRDNKDGSIRHDRYTWTDKDTGSHTHDWSKTDPTTGKHKEGSEGENAPRRRTYSGG